MVICLLFCLKCKRKHLDLIRLWFLLWKCIVPCCSCFLGPVLREKLQFGLGYWKISSAAAGLWTCCCWQTESGWMWSSNLVPFLAEMAHQSPIEQGCCFCQFWINWKCATIGRKRFLPILAFVPFSAEVAHQSPYRAGVLFLPILD